jgi:hypothetical protein
MFPNSAKERLLNRTSALTAFGAAIAMGLAALGSAPPAISQEKKPNILVIMGDDRNVPGRPRHHSCTELPATLLWIR